MQLISSNQWSAFRQAINNASETFNAEVITWKRLTKKLDYHGDDRYGNETYTSISLNSLVWYNYFNIYPQDQKSTSGIIDKNGLALIFNKDYIRGLGYINSNGTFNFDAVKDRFVVNGITYKCLGDTEGGQAYNDPVLIVIVLTKDEVPTGVSPI